MSETKVLTLGCTGMSDGSLQHQHKLILLLAYLAHNGTVSRNNVARLFWPTAANPRNSLSSALTRIRAIHPEAVSGDRSTVRSSLTTDALAFAERLAHDASPEVLDGYTGPFLDGYVVKNIGLELEEWIFETRDALTSLAAQTSADRAIEYANSGDLDRARAFAQRSLAIGGREALADLHVPDLDAILTTDEALIGRLIGPDALPRRTAAAPPSRDDNSRMIGRREDLDSLCRMLDDGHVVNLFGLGGVGKTTLANAAVERLLGDDRVARAATVRTEGGDQVSEITERVAAELELGDPDLSLADRLRAHLDAPTLLVIDDVPVGSELSELAENLAGVEGLTSLVVSRGKLEGHGLRHVPLGGLDLGRDGDSVHSPAARLFARAAKIDLTERKSSDPGPDGEIVEQLCGLVEGVPLAIEFVAAWTRLLPLREVVELLDAPDGLEAASAPDDRSVAGIVETSWNLLDPHLQQVLESLSVMEDGFNRKSALAVADASLPDLVALQDRAMIGLTESGRMRCHRLVRVWGAQRLRSRPEREAQVLARMRSHMQALVEAAVGHDEAPGGGALTKITDDLRNVELAWLSCLDAGEWHAAEAMAAPLDHYFLRVGKLVEARRLHAAALSRLEARRPGDVRIRTIITSNLAWLEMLLGRSHETARLCEAGLAMLPEVDGEAGSLEIGLLRTQCAVLGNIGEGEAALVGYRRALEIAERLGDEPKVTLLSEDIGRALLLVGDLDDAVEIFRGTLDTARRLGDQHMEARSYLLIGSAMVDQDPAHALVVLEQGERIAREQGFERLRAYFPSEVGYAQLAAGRHVDAAAAFEQGATMASEVGDEQVLLTNELGVARALVQSGDLAAARPWLDDGLRRSCHCGVWPQALGFALELVAVILDADPRNRDAEELAAEAASHPMTWPADLWRTGIEQKLRAQTVGRVDEFCERILRVFRDWAAR